MTPPRFNNCFPAFLELFLYIELLVKSLIIFLILSALKSFKSNNAVPAFKLAIEVALYLRSKTFPGLSIFFIFGVKNGPVKTIFLSSIGSNSYELGTIFRSAQLKISRTDSIFGNLFSFKNSLTPVLYSGFEAKDF